MNLSLTTSIIVITILFIILISIFLYLIKPSPKIKAIYNGGCKIYYTSKDLTYHYVNVDYSKGDRYFYTETEAMENGFNRANIK